MKKTKKHLIFEEREKLRLENMLKEKPDLKLYPNHYKVGKRVLRWWNSKAFGTAISDGREGYRQKND